MITKIVVKQGGAPRDISVAEWKALPITERVSLMNGNGVQFFAGAQTITPREALAAMK